MPEKGRFSYESPIVASEDPYPTYRWMRDEDPVHHSRSEDIWVLTRYADCSAAFRDWRTWSSERRGNLINDIPERVGKTLGTTDPPRHTFARSIVNKAFTPKTVAGLEPTIAKHAEDLSRAARERGVTEVVDEISVPFNASVLGTMFGVPGEDFVRLRRWLDDFFKREEATPGTEPTQVVAMRQLREYLAGLADERLARPGDDLVSAMLLAEEEGQRLAVEQVVVTTMTFLTAGFESTNNLFTNLVHALALHLPVLERLRRQPEQVPAFIEEGMRWDAPTQGFVRTPTRDVELHGVTVPEGSQVLLHIGSANRDEREFDRADVLDVDRPNQRHLGMGQGIHFCVGAPLARTMARALFERLLESSECWEVDLQDAARVTTPNFRGFQRLSLRLVP